MSDPIQRQVANHVLWAYTDWWGEKSEGYKPGSFVLQLINAIKQADPANRDLLRLGYSQYVAAIELIENKPDGLDVLRAAATPLEVVRTPTRTADVLHMENRREPIVKLRDGDFA